MRAIPLLLAALLLCTAAAFPQQEPVPFSPRYDLHLAAAYSNTSSHILLGSSRDRRLFDLSAGFSRRLLHKHALDWNYDLDLRPVALLDEPTLTVDATSFGPGPTIPPFHATGPVLRPCQSGTYTIPPNTNFPGFTVQFTCATRVTYGGGLSPLGQRINLRPQHRLQPFFFVNAGFLAFTRDVPSQNSARFNFTFAAGAGLELFRSHTQSLALDYSFHHLANAYRGDTNPGVDNQLVRFTYRFGR